MTTIERLRVLLDDAPQETPWRVTELPAGTGAAAFGRYIITAEESGYPGAVLEGIRAGREAALIAGGINALPALLDAVGAARELLVEAEIIRSRARALKPHPDTVSALRDAIDRLDQT